MKAMRVIVTASRDWSDWQTIHAALDELAHAARAVGERLIVAHGCAMGGDTIADSWVLRRQRAGWPVEADRKPANWKKYGKRAGMIRNAELVRMGADACLVFLNPCADTKCHIQGIHGSHGATHTGELAESEGIKTSWIGPGAQ